MNGHGSSKAQGSSKAHGFSKQLRLRSQADFDRVYRRKVYAADETLVINACANDQGHPRIGLAVSRKVGNAVVRNRWKRLIREAFRTQQSDLPPHLDLVIRPRRGAAPDFASIRASLQALCRRLEGKLRESRS